MAPSVADLRCEGCGQLAALDIDNEPLPNNSVWFHPFPLGDSDELRDLLVCDECLTKHLAGITMVENREKTAEKEVYRQENLL